MAGHSRDEIVICPPFVDIAAVVEKATGTNIEVGAQNIYWEKEGAFTAEISGEMLVGAHCKWVIIGHSERRQYFGETDDTVNRRLKVALEAGLAPIVCVGEVKEEREAGVTGDVLRRQCSRAFAGISARKAARMAVAYEPVWAIGTGLTATPEMANEAHQLIRQEAANVFGEEFAAASHPLWRQRQAGECQPVALAGGDRRRAGRRRQPQGGVILQDCEVVA